jgi:hypothetical protein
MSSKFERIVINKLDAIIGGMQSQGKRIASVEARVAVLENQALEIFRARDTVPAPSGDELADHEFPTDPAVPRPHGGE